MNLIKYKFQKGNLVKIPSMQDDIFPNKGEVLSSRFALISLTHRSLVPQKYYTVMLQERYNLDGRNNTLNCLKMEFPERDLQKLNSNLETIIVKPYSS